MIKASTILILTIANCGLFVPSIAYADNSLYRYTNDSGARVMSDAISPYYAAKGYEIIDSRGNVIKIIPKELSPEEKVRQRKQRKKQATLDAWDQKLRSRYHSLADIEATKKRRLKGVDNSITSLQLTLDNISETVKYYQAEAASNERQGVAVPKDTLSSMARLQKDRDFIEQEIEKRQANRKKIVAMFDRDAARFTIISSK
jgi:hypothetical protein